ncbi:unnamed protein product [Lactuca saligna]|uniref:Uncharacterized protein n=1 Tax=Lactuca saligna TaxID=75948 RepID=A0AA35Y6V9_LACSI|nr:unnamed protein product [Lactuca saligna]
MILPRFAWPFWQPHVRQPQVRQPHVHLHLTLSYPLHLSISPGTTPYTSKKSILPFESLFDKRQSTASLSIHSTVLICWVFSLIVVVDWQKLTSSLDEEERFGNIAGVFKVILIAISALEAGEVDTA